MKARYLKALLGTKRPVCDEGEKVCIGSAYIHDLISVDKKTIKLRYKFGVPDDAELLAIWEKLKELIDSGEMKSIIDENDVIENPIPVFTYDNDFEIVESHTDALGWPNVTYDGKLMYDNMYFADINDARKAALKEARACYSFHSERIIELGEQIEEHRKQEKIAGQAMIVLSKELGVS